MKEEQKPYRNLFKSMSLFGGVQLFTMLASVIRTKIVALWLGADGVGLLNLYLIGVETIGSATGLGLRNSFVRDIAKGRNENLSIRYTLVSLARRWSLWAGILGVIAILLFSPFLSRWSFGDDSHRWSFICLSSILFFNALVAGEQAILQGLGYLRKLAYCTVGGSALGLVLSIPVYFFFSLNGIVPALILTSLSSLIVTFFFRAHSIPKIRLTVKETLEKGKPVVMLGIYMVTTYFVSMLGTYLVMNFLQHKGGLSDVAFYLSGYTLIDKYVGFIFVAMATDYFPRLSSVSSQLQRTNDTVNRQIEVSMLLLVPITIIFLVAQPLVISILYTSEFYAVIPYTTYASLGILFRIISWPVAYIILAKGDGKVFLLTETFFLILFMVLNMVFYLWRGIEGMGIAFAVHHTIYALFMLIYCYKKYAYKSTLAIFQGLLVGIFLLSGVIYLLSLETSLVRNLFLGLIVLFVGTRSAIKLYKRYKM